MRNKKTILCTRLLPADLKATIASAGIALDERAFIETKPVLTAAVKKSITKKITEPTVVVFTSMNAVETVASCMMGQKTAWQIYTVGKATTSLAKKYFGENAVVATALNAAALAEKIIRHRNTTAVTFFCSNLRRHELRKKLGSNNIAVQEVVVYHTIPVKHTTKKNYDGILFFSPSAVNSFFSNNTTAAATVCFAIGNTTAGAIRQHCTNKIISCLMPGRENLVKKMMAYFDTGKKQHTAGLLVQPMDFNLNKQEPLKTAASK